MAGPRGLVTTAQTGPAQILQLPGLVPPALTASKPQLAGLHRLDVAQPAWECLPQLEAQACSVIIIHSMDQLDLTGKPSSQAC